MHIAHIDILRCPTSQHSLTLSAGATVDDGAIINGELRCNACGQLFPIVSGIPRFVPRENYASGFGLQWLRHARTQYDSYSGIRESERRFYDQSHWGRNLGGESVLEVGSGSGRFTEQAALTGATVVSLDYSYAVEANYASNGHRKNVLIVQADMFNMPFQRGHFDKVFCFGVLQHTPDAEAAFRALPPFLKPGGSLCTDIYSVTLLRTLFNTKYYLRPFTRRLDPQKLYGALIKYVDFMWPIATMIRKLPRGHGINWRLMIPDYSPLGLDDEILKEWAYLDAFDALAPRYDTPARKSTFHRWFVECGLVDIETEHTGHGVVGRARRAA